MDRDPTLMADELELAHLDHHPDPEIGEEPATILEVATRPPEIWVRFLTGAEAGTTVALLEPKQAYIGRSSACAVAVRDLSVSRRHAELRRSANGSFQVRDLGSRNGTLVNDQSAKTWVRADPGAVIVVGDVRLRLEVAETAQSTVLRPAQAPPAANVGRLLDEVLPPEPSRRATGARPITGLADASPPRTGFPPRSEGMRHRVRARITAVRRSPPLLLMLGIVLGLAVVAGGVTIAVFSREGPPISTEPTPLGARSPAEVAGTPDTKEALAQNPAAAEDPAEKLMAEGHAHLEAGRFSDAGSTFAAASRLAAPESELRATADRLVAKSEAEAEAQGALEAARGHLAARRWRDTVEAAGRISEDSRFREDAAHVLLQVEDAVVTPALRRADDLVGREYFTKAERDVLLPALRKWPGHPELQAKLEHTRAERKAFIDKKKAARRQPARRNRPPARSAPVSANSSDRALLTQARGAFAEKRLPSARAAAEAAADLGVPGADKLGRQIRGFDTHYERARNSRDIPTSLAAYTEALHLAEQITPGGGGYAAAIRKALAQGHYVAALQDQKLGRRDGARNHVRRALSYDARHQKALELQRELQ